MTNNLGNTKKLLAWPIIEAQKVLESINYKTPEKGYVLFEAGYGPSGLPHIGTFCEVARTIMVQNAFKKLSDIKTRFICFSDDMDGLRKVPLNFPNQKMLEQHIGKPLTAIPDPFETDKSFGDSINTKLKNFLDRFNFDYEFFSATETYKSGIFDHMMIEVMKKYDQIMDLMLPTLGEERRSTYSPFMPICKKTGKVLEVPIKKLDIATKTITYLDHDGALVETLVTGGQCKLQWKPDFGMRWAALDVDYEMCGKDHLPNAEIYSKVSEILIGKRPVQLYYEFFLNEAGNKISKSKGDNISVDEWLQYAPLESMSFFIYQAPSRAKRLHFDVIPKSVDDYIKYNQEFHAETDEDKRLTNPVYHIHNGKVPVLELHGLSFALLLNLATVCNAESKKLLWKYIAQYAPRATPENSPYLDHLSQFALNYYIDFIKNNKIYIIPSEEQKVILRKLLNMIKESSEAETGIQIQSKVFAIGMEAKYENLRDYFRDLYQILLGQEQGPRLGSFFKLLGKDETIKLIESKLR